MKWISRVSCNVSDTTVEQNNKEILLQAKYKDVEKESLKNPEDRPNQAKLLKIKQGLEILQLEKTRGAQVGSRVKWIEEGERNTKYFLNLEKGRGKKKIITKLQKKSGEVITNKTDLLNEQVNFYKKIVQPKYRSRMCNTIL